MKFSIRFTVDETAVGPVLAALNAHDGVVFDHLEIQPLSFVPFDPSEKDVADALALHKKKVAGKPKPKSKPQTGRDVVLTALAHGPVGYSQLGSILVGRGFARAGIGSLLQKLRVSGAIVRVGPAQYELPPVTVPAPALVGAVR
jgi:hypothetical protein